MIINKKNLHVARQEVLVSKLVTEDKTYEN